MTGREMWTNGQVAELPGVDPNIVVVWRSARAAVATRLAGGRPTSDPLERH